MHYYQFNIGDYASHTRGLTLMEDLAYRRLIDEYFLSERPFNGCSTDVARMIGFVQHDDSVAYVLDRFFKNVDGFWVHDRIEKDIKEFHDKREKNAKAGKASAESRRNKGDSTSVQLTFNGLSTDVQPTNNHKPLTINQEPVLKPAPCQTVSGEKKPTATATRLPDDWKPSEQDVEFCKATRPDLVPSFVADEFRDYWIAQPGVNGRKLNWPATWRNWIRKQRRQPCAPPTGKQANRDSYAAQAAEAAQRLNGGQHEPDYERDITATCSRVA
jgi:uncharacterized protein YdaU (DUF1376 family)